MHLGEGHNATGLGPSGDVLWGLRLKGSKQNSDGRDALPFSLKCLGPPVKELGMHRLDPLTNCGDTFWLGERQYVVKKVGYHYKLRGTKYEMCAKSAVLKEKARISAEEALQRMFDMDAPDVGDQ